MSGQDNEPLPELLTREEIFARLANHTLTPERAGKAMTELDNVGRKGNLSCKVAPGGGLSIYGLQKRPVTLYMRQWERLLDFAPHVLAYIAVHRDEFSVKQ